jgi:hypothetical protein
MPLAMTWFSPSWRVVERDFLVQGRWPDGVSMSSLRSHGNVLPRATDSTTACGVGESTAVAVVLVWLRTPDGVARHLAVLAEALVGGDDRRVACSASTISNKVCMSSMCGHAGARARRPTRGIRCADRTLLHDEIGHLLGIVADFDVVAAAHFVGRARDGTTILSRRRHHHPSRFRNPFETAASFVHSAVSPFSLSRKSQRYQATRSCLAPFDGI